MTRRRAVRQRVRQGLLLLSLLLFPLTMYYFSPYVIIDGAAQGIVSGSAVCFVLLFVSGLFVGRLWCGWGCPAGGLAEVCTTVNDRPARGGRWDWLKWAIWLPWLGAIVAAVLSAGGYRRLDILHLTESGVSIAQPEAYIMYYLVVGIFVGLALLFGRRAGCHYICWMAPFMILGRKLRNAFRWPALRLRAERDRCTQCRQCTAGCPMSLDVTALVQRASMEHSECILCGTCVDTCPRQVIRYTFRSGE
mgnify:CR=1 FL=1